MKFRTIFSLVLGGFALAASAQGGYQDGVDYYNADRFEKAKTILEKTLNDPSTDKAVSYFYLGSLDLREGNPAAASENFNKGVQANPAYGYNYVGLGEIALKNGNKSEASDLFKKALENNKKDAALMAAIARAYFNVDPTAYAKDIDKQIANAMKVSKNKEPQIYVLQGDMLKTTDVGAAAGRYEQAMIYDEEAGNINPEAYVKYANLYNKANPDFAIAKLVELNEKLPTSALAQSELAEKYYDGNQFTKAAEQYGKYIKNPNHFAHPGAKFTATDYTTYGEILAELKRPEEAVAAYTKAYELNPEKNKQILVDLSSMFTELEDYQKAAEYMQKYVDAGDASLNDYFILSNRYKNLGVSLPEGSPERIAAANNGIKYVDMAIESAANKGPLYRNKATLMMVRDGSEITPELVETYQQMLAAYDEDPANKEKYRDAYKSAYNNLANYYLKAGDKEQARAYFEKFLEIDPENEALRDYLKKM